MSDEEKILETTLRPNLIKILNGSLNEEINLTFLKLQNRSDPQIITTLKVKFIKTTIKLYKKIFKRIALIKKIALLMVV